MIIVVGCWTRHCQCAEMMWSLNLAALFRNAVSVVLLSSVLKRLIIIPRAIANIAAIDAFIILRYGEVSFFVFFIVLFQAPTITQASRYYDLDVNAYPAHHSAFVGTLLSSVSALRAKYKEDVLFTRFFEQLHYVMNQFFLIKKA